MERSRTILGLSKAKEEKPSRFRVTCTGFNKAGPNEICWEIDAPDEKSAALLSRKIFMLGKYKVEPVE